MAIDAATKKKKPVTIDTVSADDPLGWSWIFEPYRWSMTHERLSRRLRFFSIQEFSGSIAETMRLLAMSFSKE